MKTKSRSFAGRLSFNITVLTSLLLLVALTVAAVSSHRLIAEEAEKSASNTLDASMAQIERTLRSVEVAVSDAVWLAKEHLDDPDYLYHITSEVVSENPDIVGSAIAFRSGYFPGEHYFSPYSWVDSDGAVHSKQLGTDTYDYFSMDWYRIPAFEGRPCWCEPYYDDGGGEYLMSTYSSPILDDEWQTVAIVTSDISLKWISEMIAAIVPYEGSQTMLVSRSGRFVGHKDLSELTDETLATAPFMQAYRGGDALCEAMTSGQKGVMRISRGAKLSFAVYAPLSNGWSAALICPYGSVLARASKMHIILILIALLSLALLYFLCRVTIHALTRPLVQISDSALSIAGGNFHTKLPQVNTEDEVKRLRDSFETMQRSLTDYIEELRSSTAANERFESELNIARGIQMNMVPTSFPQRPDVDLYAMINPAKEVGGDLYDFLIRGKTLYFAVGDVSGKGVPASMIMAITRSACRFISGLNLTLAGAMGKINNSIADGNESTMFVTLFMGKLNLETGELLYCNAGHNSPVIVSPDGAASWLPVKSNLALGVFEDFEYELQSVQLAPGPTILLYTDGVTEAETASADQFGEERLLEWAGGIDRSRSAHDLTDDLNSSVREFAAGNDQNDDITIMTIKYR